MARFRGSNWKKSRRLGISLSGKITLLIWND